MRDEEFNDDNDERDDDGMAISMKATALMRTMDKKR